MEDTNTALRAAEELVEALKATSKSVSTTPAEHLGILKRVEKVRAALEQPYDRMTRHIEEASLIGVMDTLVGIGVPEKVPLSGTTTTTTTTITASALAAAANVDVSAIQRMMRLAVVNGVFVETAPDTYAHNALSRGYRRDALGPMFLIAMEQTVRTNVRLPSYFREHRPADLSDPRRSPYVYARGKEGLTFFELIDQDPEARSTWNTALAAMDKNMPISGMFPWASLRDQVEREPERPVFVDVGGGRGQALLKLREETPDVFSRGRLILQDLPIVLDTVGEEDIPGVEKMAHDIFTPQPVKNAHVYFFRRVLHDFYDPQCVEMLRNTAQAMGPDSRVIVCDMLVPETVDMNGSKEVYWLDFSLMLMSGKEKTLKEFNEIFDAAGLELAKVYPSGIGATVQLEARLKPQ